MEEYQNIIDNNIKIKEIEYNNHIEDDYEEDYQYQYDSDEEDEEEYKDNNDNNININNNNNNNMNKTDQNVKNNIINKSLQKLLIYYQDFNNEMNLSSLVYRDTIQSQSFYYLYLPISNLLLDKEHCLALKLDINFLIRVDFTIDFSNPKNAVMKISNILNYDPQKNTEFPLELSWILEHRLREYTKELSFNLDLEDNESQQYKIIKEVMKNTNCSELKVKSVLEKVKWDVNEATIYLLDNKCTDQNENNLLQTNNSVVDLTTTNNSDQNEKLLIDLEREQIIRSDLIEIHEKYPHIDMEVLSFLYESMDYSYDQTLFYLKSSSQEIENEEQITKKIKVSHYPITTLTYDSNTTTSNSNNDSDNSNLKSSISKILQESPHYTPELYQSNFNNKFIMLYLLIEGEILTCGKRCLICNQNVSFPGIRPAVCGSRLCIMGYEELGVGIDLKTEIATNPVIIDLFISLLNFGAIHDNKRLDLMFPSSVKAYQNGEEISFLLSDNSLNYNLLYEVIEKIPSVNDMVIWSQINELKIRLDEIHILIYPLLLWLVRSNRTYLRLLEKDEIPQGIKAKHVFALTSGPMEKETQFQKLRNENTECEEKSFFLFHGSSLQNWHSILRLGLKNFSNTSYMTHGAAYGPGVYFSDSLDVSSGYCYYNNPVQSTGKGWKHSQTLNSSDRCIAICEIINRPTKFTTKNTIFVIKNEEDIATRFLLVAPEPDCVKLSSKLNYECMRQSLTNLHR